MTLTGPRVRDHFDCYYRDLVSDITLISLPEQQVSRHAHRARFAPDPDQSDYQRQASSLRQAPQHCLRPQPRLQPQPQLRRSQRQPQTGKAWLLRPQAFDSVTAWRWGWAEPLGGLGAGTVGHAQSRCRVPTLCSAIAWPLLPSVVIESSPTDWDDGSVGARHCHSMDSITTGGNSATRSTGRGGYK